MGEDEGEVLERGEAGVEFLEIFILFGALDADVVGVFGVETGLFGAHAFGEFHPEFDETVALGKVLFDEFRAQAVAAIGVGEVLKQRTHDAARARLLFEDGFVSERFAHRLGVSTHEDGE